LSVLCDVILNISMEYEEQVEISKGALSIVKLHNKDGHCENLYSIIAKNDSFCRGNCKQFTANVRMYIRYK
jgi:hypothetical protein